MTRWSDLATWRGPTENQGGPMKEVRGLVLHIAEGYYEGTISYQRNPEVNVSSHFVVSNGALGQGRDGDIAQMVDTDVTAWTQSAGNGHWLSSENAGFTPNGLTAAQIEANARLLARAHRDYGVPLQLATNPDGYGLGHHSMGCNWPAGAWGHCDCPGDAIIAQKPLILARATEIVKGPRRQTMLLIKIKGNDHPEVFRSDCRNYWHIKSNDALQALLKAGHQIAEVADMAQLEDVAGKPAADVVGGVDIAALAEALAPLLPKPPTAHEIAVATINEDHARSAE